MGTVGSRWKRRAAAVCVLTLLLLVSSVTPTIAFAAGLDDGASVFTPSETGGDDGGVVGTSTDDDTGIVDTGTDIVDTDTDDNSDIVDTGTDIVDTDTDDNSDIFDTDTDIVETAVDVVGTARNESEDDGEDSVVETDIDVVDTVENETNAGDGVDTVTGDDENETNADDIVDTVTGDNETDENETGAGDVVDTVTGDDETDENETNAGDVVDSVAGDDVDDENETSAGDVVDTVTGDNENTTDADDELEAAIEATKEGAPPATANATVNATANQTATVNVSDASAGSVGVSEMNITVTRDEPYTLNVTSSEQPLDDAPDYTRRDGGVALGHIRVEHSVSDEDIANVTFTFRLSKATVEAADVTPDQVALYRYHNDTWNALDTELVRETERDYVFRAESPGLSDFTAAAKKAEFELAKAIVSPESIVTGDEVSVRVRIHNVGDADGTYAAKLLFDEEVVETQQVTIAADATRQVRFDRTPKSSGEYEVQVNDVVVGRLSVTNEATATANGTADTDTETESNTETTPAASTSASASGFGVVAALAALAVVVLCRRE